VLVVAIVPHKLLDACNNDTSFFVVERSGLDVADLGGAYDIILDQ